MLACFPFFTVNCTVNSHLLFSNRLKTVTVTAAIYSHSFSPGLEHVKLIFFHFFHFFVFKYILETFFVAAHKYNILKLHVHLCSNKMFVCFGSP